MDHVDGSPDSHPTTQRLTTLEYRGGPVGRNGTIKIKDLFGTFLGDTNKDTNLVVP